MRFQQFLELADITTRYGNGIVTVLHHKLHGLSRGRDFLYLTKVNDKGTMAAHNRRIIRYLKRQYTPIVYEQKVIMISVSR
jgi:hypothetical protein